mgnify:CR=1 FL=1
MTTLFSLCRSSFLPGAGFYLSRHLSSSPHAKVTSKISWPSLNIFLPSLMPPFHQLTIPFAVRRSFSIPEAGFSCPATHPHHHTPRSHPKCPDHLSTSSNSRAHLRPTFQDTPKIGSLKSWPKPLCPSVHKQSRRKCRNPTKLDIFSNRRKLVVSNCLFKT